MSSKNLKKGTLCLAMLSGLAAMSSASAQYVVYDPVNDAHQMAQEFIMSEQLAVEFENAVANSTSAGILAFMKKDIRSIERALTEIKPGNMLDLTTNINNKIINIDKSITNIDKNITSIENYTALNFDIDQDFTWITNNYYGDDDTLCPPDALPGECEIIIGRANTNLAKLIGKGVVDQYTDNYKDAASYGASIADKSNLTNVGFTANANQKLANDALAQALSDQRGSLMAQSVGMTKLIDAGTKAQGHGNQLQYANALAGAQAVQLAEMRSLMLASESSRAAAAQATADKEARQAASKQSLRRGLDQASSGDAGKSGPRY